jgi:hypothetical protein
MLNYNYKFKNLVKYMEKLFFKKIRLYISSRHRLRFIFYSIFIFKIFYFLFLMVIMNLILGFNSCDIIELESSNNILGIIDSTKFPSVVELNNINFQTEFKIVKINIMEGNPNDFPTEFKIKLNISEGKYEYDVYLAEAPVPVEVPAEVKMNQKFKVYISDSLIVIEPVVLEPDSKFKTVPVTVIKMVLVIVL